MIFTSGTQTLQGRTVNHDPQAYVVNSFDLGSFRTDGNYVGYRNVYDPRPEFTVHDNPILRSFRLFWPFARANGREAMQGYLEGFLTSMRGTPEQLEHACRVLTLIVKCTNS